MRGRNPPCYPRRMPPKKAAPLRVSIAVMHHLSRPEVLARLEADLAAMSLEYEVVHDPEPYGPTNPWRTARLAWAGTPAKCTHRLVLQDDAIPCEHFAEGLELALTAQPAAPVSFFVNWLGHQCGRAQQEALERCDTWCRLPMNGWYPTVALALPRAMALDLAAWETPRPIIADDAVVAQWANHRRIAILQTCPSLVQHDEEAPSTITQHMDARRRGGRAAACCYLGDVHPAELDWTRGPR